MTQPARDDIQSGIICKLVGRKFYGFIATEDKPYGIFFHGSSLGAGIKFGDLREGQQVRFKTQLHTVKGTRQAYDVELVQSPDQDQDHLYTKSGTISSLVLSKRFGFIQPLNDGPSIFFHWTGVCDPGGFDGLREGDQVAYLAITDTKERYKAVGVVRE